MDYRYELKRNAQVCGIADSYDLSPKLQLPTTVQLRKIRRLALKTRASTACLECKKFKRKCSDHRPCPRCLAFGIEAFCSKDVGATSGSLDNSETLEFPISYNVNNINFSQTGLSRFPDVVLKHPWTFQVTRAHWTIGYRISSLVKLLDSLPLDMTLAVQNLCNAIEVLKKIQTKTIEQVARRQALELGTDAEQVCWCRLFTGCFRSEGDTCLRWSS